MASTMALRRGTNLASSLINKLRPTSTAPSTISRSFNTNSQMREYSDEDDRNNLDIDRRSDSISRRPTIFGDVFDPFSAAPRSLTQVLNLMDQMLENPFTNLPRSAGLRRGWDAKEDENGLYLRVDMPGLGKEDVKISVEQNTLFIKGEGEKESGGDDTERRYSSRIEIPEKVFKADEIKAEMKNGVLKVFVPKVKEEERKDVFEVKVE